LSEVWLLNFLRLYGYPGTQYINTYLITSTNSSSYKPAANGVLKPNARAQPWALPSFLSRWWSPSSLEVSQAPMATTKNRANTFQQVGGNPSWCPKYVCQLGVIHPKIESWTVEHVNDMFETTNQYT
jgi:hypothetical protein